MLASASRLQLRKQNSNTISVINCRSFANPAMSKESTEETGIPVETAASTSRSTHAEPISVYSHIDGIQEIGQLRGLRPGRRRARFRGMRKNEEAEALRYVQAWAALEPACLRESIRLQEARVLVAAAIEHFANTMCGIVARLEGDPEVKTTTAVAPCAQPMDPSSSQNINAKAEAKALRRRLERALNMKDIPGLNSSDSDSD